MHGSTTNSNVACTRSCGAASRWRQHVNSVHVYIKNVFKALVYQTRAKKSNTHSWRGLCSTTFTISTAASTTTTSTTSAAATATAAAIQHGGHITRRVQRNHRRDRRRRCAIPVGRHTDGAVQCGVRGGEQTRNAETRDGAHARVGHAAGARVWMMHIYTEAREF